MEKERVSVDEMTWLVNHVRMQDVVKSRTNVFSGRGNVSAYKDFQTAGLSSADIDKLDAILEKLTGKPPAQTHSSLNGPVRRVEEIEEVNDALLGLAAQYVDLHQRRNRKGENVMDCFPKEHATMEERKIALVCFQALNVPFEVRETSLSADGKVMRIDNPTRYDRLQRIIAGYNQRQSARNTSRLSSRPSASHAM